MYKRGKSKYILTHGVIDHYDTYSEDMGGLLKKDLYKKILKSINQRIVDDIILKGQDYKINGIGYVEVRKKKIRIELDQNGKPITKKLRQNYKATRDLWAKLYPGLNMEQIKEQYPDRPRVYHTNEHNGGFDVKIGFNTNSYNFKNRAHYSFIPNRDMKRKLNIAIREGIQIYES